MEDLVETVIENVPDFLVTTVRLELGRSACVSAEALHFCFDIATKGTKLEGAMLEIAVTSGETLRIKEVEVA